MAYEIMIKSNGKWVPEHRHIMENVLGRKLGKKDIVHHINGMHNDNRIENLVVLSYKDHTTIHGRERSIKQQYASERWFAKNYNCDIESRIKSNFELMLYHRFGSEKLLEYLYRQFKEIKETPADQS